MKSLPGIRVASLAFIMEGLLLALGSGLAQAQSLYVSDGDNAVIDYSLSTGTGTAVNTGTDTLDGPRGLAITSTDLYIANAYTPEVDVVPLDGSTPFILTTTGYDEIGEGLAISGSTLYIGNDNGATAPVYSVPLSGGTVSAVATSPNTSNDSYALLADGSGNLYVASLSTNQILKVSLSGGTSTVVSTGLLSLNAPAGLALDSSNNLYVANEGNNTIDVISLAGGTAYQLNVTGVTFSELRGIALDGAGNLYAANQGNDTVDKISLSTGAGSVFATVNAPTNLLYSGAPEPPTWALLGAAGLGAWLLRGLAFRRTRSEPQPAPVQARVAVRLSR